MAVSNLFECLVDNAPTYFDVSGDCGRMVRLILIAPFGGGLYTPIQQVIEPTCSAQEFAWLADVFRADGWELFGVQVVNPGFGHVPRGYVPPRPTSSH